jgi:hypothetical protein
MEGGEGFIARMAQLSIQENDSRRQAIYRRSRAVDDEIANFYGTDLTDLEIWQRLCKDLSIEPTPRSITQCKKVCHLQSSGLDVSDC